jgi:riboflavin synthase
VFSGIIETTGTILEREPRGSGAVLVVEGRFATGALALGESIATSGVCLTVREAREDGFLADLSRETLDRTTLGGLAPGGRVNLERSLRVGDRVGGHFVFGHVDGIGRLSEIRDEGGSSRFVFLAPQDFSRFLVDKGSIAVDGVSLTMIDCGASSFSVAVVPHTLEMTTLRDRRPGDPVNLEADMLARYAQRGLAAG